MLLQQRCPSSDHEGELAPVFGRFLLLATSLLLVGGSLLFRGRASARYPLALAVLFWLLLIREAQLLGPAGVLIAGCGFLVGVRKAAAGRWRRPTDVPGI